MKKLTVFLKILLTSGEGMKNRFSCTSAGERLTLVLGWLDAKAVAGCSNFSIIDYFDFSEEICIKMRDKGDVLKVELER